MLVPMLLIGDAILLKCGAAFLGPTRRLATIHIDQPLHVPYALALGDNSRLSDQVFGQFDYSGPLSNVRLRYA